MTCVCGGGRVESWAERERQTDRQRNGQTGRRAERETERKTVGEIDE